MRLTVNMYQNMDNLGIDDDFYFIFDLLYEMNLITTLLWSTWSSGYQV